MIRIRKAAEAPMILRERGAMLTAELCARIDAGEAPSFHRDVYGAAEVKHALSAAQHDKCCFCESKLQHAQFGDVEHFRPKATALQEPAGPSAPGYYWLAYAWENLYLSCEVCNRRHKRGLFPLLNPEQRVTSHHRRTTLALEQPMFVDPGNDDPTVLIEFRKELAVARNGNDRGAVTIEALQLNRAALWDRRRERHELLFACLTVLARATRSDLLENDRLDATRILDAVIAMASEHGEYSSMTRSVLRRVAPWRQTWVSPAASLLDSLRTDVAAGLVLLIDEI